MFECVFLHGFIFQLRGFANLLGAANSSVFRFLFLLPKLRTWVRFNCLYAAESLKIPLEMVGFGRSMDAAGINWTLLWRWRSMARPLRAVKLRTVPLASFGRVHRHDPSDAL